MRLKRPGLKSWFLSEYLPTMNLMSSLFKGTCKQVLFIKFSLGYLTALPLLDIRGATSYIKIHISNRYLFIQPEYGRCPTLKHKKMYLKYLSKLANMFELPSTIFFYYLGSKVFLLLYLHHITTTALVDFSCSIIEQICLEFSI